MTCERRDLTVFRVTRVGFPVSLPMSLIQPGCPRSQGPSPEGWLWLCALVAACTQTAFLVVCFGVAPSGLRLLRGHGAACESRCLCVLSAAHLSLVASCVNIAFFQLVEYL